MDDDIYECDTDRARALEFNVMNKNSSGVR